MGSPATVEDIQRTITTSPDRELVRLREWFEDLDAQIWDGQIEAHIRAGKLEPLAREALDEYHAGRCDEL
jgi:hypothetical protein